MYEIPEKDLQDQNIDLSMISITRTIRGLAKLDRIKLDTSEHRSGLNKHLFDYIKYCGLDVLDFVKTYLANLQPYMVYRNNSQEKQNNFICVIDNLYRVSIYIKMDTTQFEELIISFHEDNKRGIAKTNSIIKLDSSRYVPIFADSICSHHSGENKFVVKGFFQRGLKTLPLELPAMQHKDVFIVEKRSIDDMFISYCNDYIRDLYASNLDLDYDSVDIFSFLQQISFTSYGRDTFSNISLLIDSICIQKSYIGKAESDLALITYVRNIKLTKSQKDELVNLLKQKFVVTRIKGIDLILKRVETNLIPIDLDNDVKELTPFN